LCIILLALSTSIPLNYFRGVFDMKNKLNQLSFIIGLGCLALVSAPAFATVPEMDGELIGQVGLLIAGVALVARAISKK